MRSAFRVVTGSDELRTDPRRSASVAAENARAERAAAMLSDDDARLLFATRVAGRLDGGPAAILTPERRGDLLRFASTLGLRPFDAHLIIAIEQDRARRSDRPDDRPADSRLRLVRPAEPAPAPSWWLVAATAAAAIAAAALLARWLTAGI